MRLKGLFGLTLLTLLLLHAPPVDAAKPSFSVLFGGEPLPDDALRRIGEVVVEQRANDADSCTITFLGSRSGPPEVPATVGAAMAITVGASQSEGMLFEGEIASVELVVEERGRPMVRIVGYDNLHRLTRTRQTKVWEESSDSDAASRVAGEAGLGASVDKTPYARGYILQRNESDLVFLRRRAARIGYEIGVEGDALTFRPVRDGADPADVTLTGPFRPLHLTAGEQVERVVVRGWNPDKKEAIVGEARTTSSTLGRNTGDVQADALAETPALSDGLVFSQEEADAVAAAVLRDAVGMSASGEVGTDGDPGLRPGLLVDLGGAGDRFDGKYIVVGATHRFSRGKRGRYTTTLIVRRAGGIRTGGSVDGKR